MKTFFFLAGVITLIGGLGLEVFLATTATAMTVMWGLSVVFFVLAYVLQAGELTKAKAAATTAVAATEKALEAVSLMATALAVKKSTDQPASPPSGTE